MPAVNELGERRLHVHHCASLTIRGVIARFRAGDPVITVRADDPLLAAAPGFMRTAEITGYSAGAEYDARECDQPHYAL
jgi:archaeosine-15-forming tRNA-guanine transglycosylase